MTKKELINKLRGYPHRQEARRRDCAIRLGELLGDKNAFICGARAQSFDTPGHGNKTADPTGAEVMGLIQRYDTDISVATRQMNDLMDEINLLDKALEWLRMQKNGYQLYSVVCQRYINGQGWNAARASINIHYEDRRTRDFGYSGIDMMLNWINR